MNVDHAPAIWNIAHTAAYARYQDLLTAFATEHGPVVQTGPFAGMTLPMEQSWGHGDLLSKLIGCYEAELHRAIAEAVAWQPDTVVNIGAAEGYYAVGLARILPDIRCHAFDISESAQAICRTTALINGVADRVTVGGSCTPETLQAVCADAVRPLIVCDCEGAERELIDPSGVPALVRSTLLVECHDFLDPTITDTLVDRLSSTHELYLVSEGARDPNAVPFLRDRNSLERWIAVCEFRPSTMHWLYGRPQTR
ncbi:MAG: hypothetical protein AB7O80_08945 [Acetobacteraceae bacterium]